MKKIRIIMFVICVLLNLEYGLYPKLIPENKHDNAKWFNLMLNGKKIGYFSFQRIYETKNLEEIIIQREESVMNFERQQNTLSAYTNSVKKMDHSGRLLYFKYYSQQTGSKYEIEGSLNYNKQEVRITYRREEQQRREMLQILKDSLTEYQALMKLRTTGHHGHHWVTH